MKKKVLATLMFISRLSLIVFIVQTVFVNLMFADEAKAQLEVMIEVEPSTISVGEIFKRIESKTDYHFIYDAHKIDVNQTVWVSDQLTVGELFDVLETELGLAFKPIRNTITVSTKRHRKRVISGASTAGVWTDPRLFQAVVTGRVTTAEEEPIAGVNVKVKGGLTATTTDAAGNYSMNASPSDILVFSYIGYIAQEAEVGDRTLINIVMEDDVQGLEEVVVVGYGTVKKSDLTGSVGQVSSDELTAFPTANAVMSLQGKTAGVQVLQNSGAPGANISVRIRGGNSLQGNNEPLYVVDGFPLSEAPNAINPNDIESIEVLKDASATAIYGSRGANGVVMITTKQGKAGTTMVDYAGYYAVQQVGKKIDLLNGREFAELMNVRAENDGMNPYFSQDEVNAFGKGTDWQDVIFRNAPMQNHSITVAGGGANTQFSVSGSYLGQEGIIVGSNIRRASLRANVTQAIGEKVKLNYNAILTNSNNAQISSDNGQKGNTVLSAALGVSPTIAPKDAYGNYNDVTPYSFSPNSVINPLAMALERQQALNNKSIIAGTVLSYEPIRKLVVRSSVGVEGKFGRADTYSPSIIRFTPLGEAHIMSSDRMNILNENTVTYNKKFNEDHDVTMLAGITYQQNTWKSFNTGFVTGFSTDLLGTNNLQSGSVPGNPASDLSKWAIFSYLGRLNYSYQGKYLFTASLRADGSSRFGEGNKWGYFPSAAFAWRAIDESFIQDLGVFSDLKLRLSYGVTGSTALAPYQTLNTLRPFTIIYNNQQHIGYGPSLAQLANPHLKWETTAQTDIGLDIGFARNRLSFVFDLYRKDTRDLLQNVPIPTSTGYNTTVRNIGSIRNSGIELGLNAKILNNAFKWDMHLNVSKNKSKVIELAGGSDVFGAQLPQPLSVAVNLVRVGLPVGVFYGYLEDGMDENGIIKYKDLDGNGDITLNDRTIIGDPNPDFLYNVTSTMSYKGFQLDWALQGKQGGDVFNVNLSSQGSSIYFGENQLKDLYDNHWTPANPNAKYPKLSANAKFRESDRYVEDGSFLRLRNVQLAYNIPAHVAKWARGLQVYVSAQNLLTMTNYSWYDPEVNTRGGSNSVSIGIDNSGYPNAKSYTVGARINL